MRTCSGESTTMPSHRWDTHRPLSEDRQPDLYRLWEGHQVFRPPTPDTSHPQLKHPAPSPAFPKDPPARGAKVRPHAQTSCRTELSINLPVLWPALTPANGKPQPLIASFIHTWWGHCVLGGWMGSHPLLHRPVPGLVLGGSCKPSFVRFPQPVTHSDDETSAA